MITDEENDLDFTQMTEQEIENQESDKDGNKNTSKETSPEKKSPDYEKSYKEVQAFATKVAQENAAIKKEIDSLKGTLGSIGKTEESKGTSLDDDIEQLKKDIAYLEANKYSTATQRVALKNAIQLRNQEISAQQTQRKYAEFDTFAEAHEQELTDNVFTIKSLMAIQNDAAKRGYEIDLESARALYLDKNRDKWLNLELEKRQKAGTARMHDGGDSPISEKREKTVAEKKAEELFGNL